MKQEEGQDQATTRRCLKLQPTLLHSQHSSRSKTLCTPTTSRNSSKSDAEDNSNRRRSSKMTAANQMRRTTTATTTRRSITRYKNSNNKMRYSDRNNNTGARRKKPAAIGGKTLNYSEDEDYLIAILYVYVTIDPIKGCWAERC
jgi:hypothetical protein